MSASKRLIKLARKKCLKDPQQVRDCALFKEWYTQDSLRLADFVYKQSAQYLIDTLTHLAKRKPPIKALTYPRTKRVKRPYILGDKVWKCDARLGFHVYYQRIRWRTI